jgi:hypothetical protein
LFDETLGDKDGLELPCALAPPPVIAVLFNL